MYMMYRVSIFVSSFFPENEDDNDDNSIVGAAVKRLRKTLMRVMAFQLGRALLIRAMNERRLANELLLTELRRQPSHGRGRVRRINWHAYRILLLRFEMSARVEMQRANRDAASAYSEAAIVEWDKRHSPVGSRRIGRGPFG